MIPRTESTTHTDSTTHADLHADAILQPLRKPLWLLFCLLPAFHCLLLLSIQASLSLIVFVLLIWAAAFLAAEDLLIGLSVSPSRRGFPWGIGLLLLLLLRGSVVQTAGDPFVVLAPATMALALLLLCRPPQELPRWREPLLALGLTPLLLWLPPWVPSAALSSATARLSALLLQLLGFDAFDKNAVVAVGTGAVIVAGPCTGVEQIVQALLVGLLAWLLVPLPNRWLRLPVLALAPLCGWLANAVRIALLALLASWDPQAAAEDQGWFSFFHVGEGGLLFSALGILFYGLIHSRLLDRQLRARGR